MVQQAQPDSTMFLPAKKGSLRASSSLEQCAILLRQTEVTLAATTGVEIPSWSDLSDSEKKPYLEKASTRDYTDATSDHKQPLILTEVADIFDQFQVVITDFFMEVLDAKSI